MLQEVDGHIIQRAEHKTNEFFWQQVNIIAWRLTHFCTVNFALVFRHSYNGKLRMSSWMFVTYAPKASH